MFKKSTFIVTKSENSLSVAALAAALLLAVAYGFQATGYHPCELCWWQRYPYFAILGVGALAKATNQSAKLWPIALIALLYTTDLGIAVFHIGVEEKLWQGLDTCSGSFDMAGMTADQLLSQLSDTPVVPCDEAAWRLFGISMAGYNAIAAVSLTIFCGCALLSRPKGDA